MFNIKSELSCKGVALGDNGDLWNFHHNKMLQSGVDADIKEAMNVACTDAYGDLLTLCTILLLTPLVWSLNLNRTKFWKKRHLLFYFWCMENRARIYSLRLYQDFSLLLHNFDVTQHENRVWLLTIFPSIYFYFSFSQFFFWKCIFYSRYFIRV